MMELILTLVIAGAVFAVCYGIDRAFTRLFRSKAQHMSGLAVRASKRYGVFGVVLTVVGILAICAGVTDGPVLLVGGILVLLMGLGLAAYYLGFGIFYDGESFLFATPGKKSRAYFYRDIAGQKLYLVQGGNLIIELHMADGQTVSLQSSMEGVIPFLDTAFAGWCLATHTDPQSCDFHDPSKSLWFPTVEDT